MRHYTRLVNVVLGLLFVSAFAVAPASAGAFWEGFPFGSPGKGNSPAQEKVLSNLPFKFCERTISAAGISIKFNLPSKKCDTTPPPPPDEEEPTLDFSADPTTIEEGDSSTLEWDSTDAVSCTASGGWSGGKALDGTQVVTPSATTTYTLECENDEGEVTKSVTVNVIPEGPVPLEPTLDFTADPETVNEGDSALLEWESNNATSCVASGGWSGSKTLVGSQQVTPSATTTYTLTCENDEDDEVVESVTVGVILDEEPEPEGKLLITEVLYDLNLSTTSPQGSEGANEWVEIYNGTDEAVDLGDYFISDATGSDALPSVMLPAGAFAVITASSTTASFWDIPEDAVVIVLGNNIGSNGLANGGDAVFLRDAASSTVDSVSWGSNTDAFEPAVDGVDANSGDSIARIDNEVDTNEAVDWEHRETPTPGE